MPTHEMLSFLNSYIVQDINLISMHSLKSKLILGYSDGRSQQVKSSTDGNNDDWQSEDDVQDI